MVQNVCISSTIPGRGSAINHVDYYLYDTLTDKRTDRVCLVIKNKSGAFILVVDEDIKQTKQVVLDVSIANNARIVEKQITIILTPPQEKKGKPKEEGDSIVCKIINDLKIPISNNKENKDTLLYLDTLRYSSFENGKILLEAFDTKARIYTSDTIVYKRVWDDSDRLYLRGDMAGSFIKLRDFLSCQIKKANSSVLKADPQSPNVIFPFKK